MTVTTMSVSIAIRGTSFDTGESYPSSCVWPRLLFAHGEETRTTHCPTAAAVIVISASYVPLGVPRVTIAPEGYAGDFELGAAVVDTNGLNLLNAVPADFGAEPRATHEKFSPS